MKRGKITQIRTAQIRTAQTRTAKLRTAQIRLGMLVGLALLVAILPLNLLKVQAKDIIATVSGTVMSGTTSDLLLLSTKDGKMEIKLDSETDTSACKILLKDKKIFVSVYRGSDKYLHADKITSETQAPAVTLDLSKTTTISGSLGEKSSDELLYVNTAQGEMKIKLDATTNMGGCSFLINGKNYYITCARGSDAYMHAVSIVDTAPASAPGGLSVTGTVANSTKEGHLYLATKDGEMQFKIDSNADTSKGMVLTPGNTLTVYFYRGTDAYLHASIIVGVKDNATAVTLDTATMTKVTGTVESDSTENTLYLNTPQGRMILKLDYAVNDSNCKSLISGKKISVNCVRGSDAYMHALNISNAG